jgi:diphthine-ammonia ligase
MFQTVGHNVIDAYATCTGLPLFREPIRGEARQQALQYEAAAGDEVEDLFALLARAKAALPELEAVACGAILSTYQRTRVESVCSRLGLVSLAFLWQRDQRALLAEMVATPVAAILIKTAAMGLEPRRHLGRTIAELQPQLLELEQRYGLNVCGEGGEYETLTLDCPLFVKRLVMCVRACGRTACAASRASASQSRAQRSVRAGGRLAKQHCCGCVCACNAISR